MAVTASAATDCAASAPCVDPGTVVAGQAWTLDFGDEFNTTALDTTKWRTGRWSQTTTGDNPYNPDIEGAFFSSNNVGVANGNLNLTIKPEVQTINNVTYTYSSGNVNSETKYALTPGTYVEARIKVPQGDGLWPAYWETPANIWPPEMDFFEFFDTNVQGQPRFNFHRADGSQTGPSVYGAPGVDYRNAYHVYGTLWTGTEAVPYIDGQPYDVGVRTTTNVPMFLIFNLSMYANHHPLAGTQMNVDWVRVWRPSSPPPVPATANPESINDAATGLGANQFSYTGTWATTINTVGPYLNDNHFTRTRNASYQMTFSGVQAKIYTERNTNMGIVGISVDGGPEKLVDAYGVARSEQQLLFATPVLPSGSHTVRVRITGTKNASSSNTYAVADRIDVLSSTTAAVSTLNDATAGPGPGQFNYAEPWSTSTPVGTLNGDNHYTNVVGASYQMQFSGTQATIYSEKSSALGIVGISVDGGAETLVDPYSGGRLEQQFLYASPVLTSGVHILRVRNTGTKNMNSTGTYAVADRIDVQN